MLINLMPWRARQKRRHQYYALFCFMLFSIFICAICYLKYYPKWQQDDRQRQENITYLRKQLTLFKSKNFIITEKKYQQFKTLYPIYIKHQYAMHQLLKNLALINQYFSQKIRLSQLSFRNQAYQLYGKILSPRMIHRILQKIYPRLTPCTIHLSSKTTTKFQLKLVPQGTSCEKSI